MPTSARPRGKLADQDRREMQHIREDPQSLRNRREIRRGRLVKMVIIVCVTMNILACARNLKAFDSVFGNIPIVLRTKTLSYNPVDGTQTSGRDVADEAVVEETLGRISTVALTSQAGEEGNSDTDSISTNITKETAEPKVSSPTTAPHSLKILWAEIEWVHSEAMRGVDIYEWRDSIVEPDKNSVDNMYALRDSWRQFIELAPPYKRYGALFSGAGIVILGGGRYFTQAWVNIHVLRAVKCDLPIELWYTNAEVDSVEPHRNALHDLGVTLRNLGAIVDPSEEGAARQVYGFALKMVSILFSSFQEVLFLDADNNVARDPSYLFEDEVY
eukprot:CAMPEP_0118927734 /NCGR_PEP_ID=MMETSP1169-20130426/5154_1 /TAXON_ID=36882 /ORGANISM="Pyramimonas obovata, Strain CCMP722" /LENGTH=329 /DNA_ID=CAMNT_0006869565 /DNA_START=244 /DNA_END=1230 /DNA_ORIENTATION=-